jgi:aminoglycoside phosphotransferase (APT) family kinase protein
MLSCWYEPGDPEGKKPVVQPWDGLMSRADIVTLYGEISGRDMSDMPWYFCLACYKLACILEGSYARSKSGQTSVETGDFLRQYALWLLKKSRQIIATGSVSAE